MLKVILAFAVVILINLKGLLTANPRGKIMGIYFSVMGVSLLISILLSVERRPTSPNVIITNIIKLIGLGE